MDRTLGLLITHAIIRAFCRPFTMSEGRRVEGRARCPPILGALDDLLCIERDPTTSTSSTCRGTRHKALHPTESMAMRDQLLRRLSNREDNFTERKSDGAKPAELRRTLVAFANSVPEGQTAILFLGVRDDGQLQGVRDTDSLQKTVRQICERDCYPPLKYATSVLEIDGKAVIAVEVPPSTDRPHFSGAAYVRRGSENVVASEALFSKMVRSRLGKPREILQWKDQLITVVARGKELGETRMLGDPRYYVTHECRVQDCSAHVVTLHDLTTGRIVTEPLENVMLSRDQRKFGRLMLIVQEHG